MTDSVRTPDERFAGLPDFPWEPQYLDWDGLRLARIDEGEGPIVVLFHGEPTWSFLWRKVIPPLLDAGYRCIAPDLPGFGRSDKPTDLGWYSYDRHVEAATWMLEQAGVRDATFVVHDWGGPIGMRVAAERPEICSRIVVMDTGIFNGRQRMTDAWKAFRDFVERTEDLPISMLVKGACAIEPGEDVVAAYDAPFPDPDVEGGRPRLPADAADEPRRSRGRRGLGRGRGIAARSLPSLCLWADSDPIIPIETGRAVAARLNLTPPETIANASHFLQEDQGAAIGERIAAWLGEH